MTLKVIYFYLIFSSNIWEFVCIAKSFVLYQNSAIIQQVAPIASFPLYISAINQPIESHIIYNNLR